MTFVTFLGVLTIAFGPPATVYGMVVHKTAVNAVICMLSAFCWIVGLVCCAATWNAITPLQHTMWFVVLYSCAWQELFRFFVFRLYRSYEAGVARLTGKSVFTVADDAASSLSCGLGIGIAHTGLFCVQALAESATAATQYSDTCEGVNMFYSTAFNCLAFDILNCAWTVIAFKAWREHSHGGVVVVVMSHVLAGMLTTVGDCTVSLPLLFVLAVAMVGAAFFMFRSSRARRLDLAAN